MKIDAHQHFWKYDASQFDWIDDNMAPLRRDFLPEDVRPLMTRAGLDAAVAVQARQTVEETSFLLELADRHPWIVGVVGWIDLRSPEARAELERFTRHPKLVGIRHIVQAEADDRFLLREDFGRGIALLAEFDLAYDILIYPRHLPVAAEFARRFNNHRFVLDHLAKPEISRGEIRGWERDLRALAAQPNVFCKLSGLVTEADWPRWTPEQLRPYLDAAFESFGPQRLMVGSDWPVCTLAGEYERVMAVLVDYVADRDREAVLGGNAARFFRLERTS
jgi:L-fuconolactonase